MLTLTLPTKYYNISVSCLNTQKCSYLNLIHPLPSVTKLSDTIVLQNFPKFASVFNIVNLV